MLRKRKRAKAGSSERFCRILKQTSPKPKPSDSQEAAFPRALRWLGYRPRSEAELRNFLVRRGYPPTVIEKTLAKLRSLNYLSDEAFARNWARSRVETGRYGPKRVEQELRAKGISQVLIRKVMGEAFAQINESATAKTLLQKRFKTNQLDDPKLLRRAASFLKRRGFSSDVIFDLLNEPLKDD
ncbi:MAG TPA: regulatory protein RecX [Candidatus Binatia bacterium]|nr:regulatory protein RecX [Candidatus Binatia bacterium]